MTVCHWPCVSKWTNWPRAASWTTASTCWPSDCPAPARPTRSAPWATVWWKTGTPSSSLRPTAWPRPARRQARPGPATPAAQAGQLRLPAPGRLGLPPQGNEESEVLFTLIAERYERRSLGITSNLVFSEWERIFANPMATAAAIDRVVHHSVILEFDVPSYRTNAAQQRGEATEVNRQN